MHGRAETLPDGGPRKNRDFREVTRIRCTTWRPRRWNLRTRMESARLEQRHLRRGLRARTCVARRLPLPSMENDRFQRFHPRFFICDASVAADLSGALPFSVCRPQPAGRNESRGSHRRGGGGPRSSLSRPDASLRHGGSTNPPP